MRKTILMLILLAVIGLLQGFEVPLSEQPVLEYDNLVSDFVRISPRDSVPLPLDTKVWFWHDSVNLYVRWEAKIDATFTPGKYDNRDESEDCDFLSLQLITGADNQYAYYYQALPHGNKYDGIRRADLSLELAWNSTYSYTNTITDSLWTCQMTIPFKDLRYSGTPPYKWKVIVSRYLSRQEHHYSYPFCSANMGPDYFRNAANLVIARHPKSKSRARFYGYLFGGVGPRLELHLFDDEESRTYTELDADAGLDLSLNLGTANGLKFALNPDFYDAPMTIKNDWYNLIRWPSHPENRTFFIQDVDILDFGKELFDSRNAHKPLYALNLTGVADILSYGILSVKNQRHECDAYLIDDEERHVIEDDFYNVVSAKARIAKNSLQMACLSRMNHGYQNDVMLVKPVAYLYKNNFLWVEYLHSRKIANGKKRTGSLARIGAEINLHDLRLEAQYGDCSKDFAADMGQFDYSDFREFQTAASFSHVLSSKLLKSCQATLEYDNIRSKDDAPIKTSLGGLFEVALPLKLSCSLSHYAGKELYEGKTHNWDKSSVHLLFYLFPWLRPEAGFGRNHTLFFEKNDVYREDIRSLGISGYVGKHFAYKLIFRKLKIHPDFDRSNLKNKYLFADIDLKANFSNATSLIFSLEKRGLELAHEFKEDCFFRTGISFTRGFHFSMPFFYLKINLSF